MLKMSLFINHVITFLFEFAKMKHFDSIVFILRKLYR